MAGKKFSGEQLQESLKVKWIPTVVAWMKLGHPEADIREKLKKEKKGSVSDPAINTIISEAKQKIREEQFTNRETIKGQHIAMYNNMIGVLLATKDGDDLIEEAELAGEEMGEMDSDQYFKLKQKKEIAYNDAMNAMRQKEELLRFHDRDFEINVNSEETITFKKSSLRVDITKLTPEERVEYLALGMIAKIGEDELAGITVRPSEENVETVDVEHEVIEELPNVALIKQVDPEGEPVKIKKPKAEVFSGLQAIINKVAAQRFKEVGTLTEEEKKLLE